MAAATFGASELIVGTILSTVGAVLVALVVGLGAAVFIAELCPRWLRGPIEAVVQLMAGIPSVVFGLVGLAIVVPCLMDHAIPANAGDVMPDIPFDGTSLLAGVIVLTFMILPFFVTVAVDALRAVPRSYLDGGMALGMTRWRAITRLQIPAATPGLIAGIVLGHVARDRGGHRDVHGRRFARAHPHARARPAAVRPAADPNDRLSDRGHRH